MGFSFAIAAQLLTAETTRPGSHNSAVALFISRFVCLCACGIGILYFANQAQPADQRELGSTFVILLVYALGMFLFGLARMFHTYIKHRDHYVMLGLTLAFALAIVIQGIVLTKS